MAPPGTASRPPPPAWLLTGPEPVLLDRAAARLLEQTAGGQQLDVTDARAADLRDTGLGDLRTPSLFGAPRALVVRDAHNLPAEASAALLAELDGTAPQTTIVLLATGTGRIRALAKRIGDLGGRVDVAPPRDWEDAKWARLVADEFRRHGRVADGDAVATLLRRAGTDVAVIVEKVAQVVAAAQPGQITSGDVERAVVGHGDRGSFAVADAMCDRRPGEAVVLLRGTLEAGADPVLVLGALAYRLRSLLAVAGRVDARTIGLNLSSGQVRRLQGVRRNFGPGELGAAYAELARADREIKGGELPADLILERAVLAIATRG